jgi:ParB family transcriptional regulator, chromosome partitioning protein
VEGARHAEVCKGEAMPARLESKPLAWFKPDPNQPRKHFDEAALRSLGDSLKVRQNDPVQAKPDGTLIDGERRWRAAGLVGVDKLEVIITDAALTDSEINIVRLTSFFHRQDLNAYEQWLACEQLLTLNPSWLAKDLAEHLHIDRSMVTRLLSPSKCITDWKEALKEGKVGITDVYAASKRPEPEQGELLAMKLSGASRDAIERVRRSKSAAVPQEKVNKLKCVLPSGMQVAISGKSVSLDEAIDALAESLKSARKARDEGLTAKSWSAAMKDKARLKE